MDGTEKWLGKEGERKEEMRMIWMWDGGEEGGEWGDEMGGRVEEEGEG